MQITVCDGDGQGFVLKSRDGITSVSFKMLEYVEVINKTVSFHLADGTFFEVNAALADFEGQLLSRSEFLKTHRSYLVNLNYIQTITSNCAVTKRGHRIPVSRKRRNQVQDTYMRFMLQSDSGISVQDAQKALFLEKKERAEGPWRILLVDDDPVDRAFWSDVLRRHGCVVRSAGSGREAIKLAEGGFCDGVLLDVLIPGEDGFSVCERLRKLTHAPIIFLSSLTESEKQLRGFAAGGIDYITKDTPAELFWAKVETRIKLAVSDRTQFCYDPLILDLSERRVLINGRELPLTSIEFDILWRLLERPEHVFTPEEIFGIVCGSQSEDGGQMVQIHMSRLRRKLEKAWEKHHFIETVWGEGYRFVPANS